MAEKKSQLLQYVHHNACHDFEKTFCLQHGLGVTACRYHHPGGMLTWRVALVTGSLPSDEAAEVSAHRSLLPKMAPMLQ